MDHVRVRVRVRVIPVTIQEAIRSGRRITRPLHSMWTTVGIEALILTKEDALAEDWQIECKEVNVTYEFLRHSLRTVMGQPYGGEHFDNLINALAKELGLL